MLKSSEHSSILVCVVLSWYSIDWKASNKTIIICTRIYSFIIFSFCLSGKFIWAVYPIRQANSVVSSEKIFMDQVFLAWSMADKIKKLPEIIIQLFQDSKNGDSIRISLLIISLPTRMYTQSVANENRIFWLQLFFKYWYKNFFRILCVLHKWMPPNRII